MGAILESEKSQLCVAATKAGSAQTSVKGQGRWKDRERKGGAFILLMESVGTLSKASNLSMVRNQW